MPRLFFLLGSVTAVLLLSITPAHACGDKLLAMNRGLRSQDFASARHASILVYTHASSRISGAIKYGQLQSTLVNAGHQLETVEERSRLDEALKSRHYDLVVVDLTDAPGVEESLRGTPSPPLVVPVVYDGTKAEDKSVKKRYHSLLKSPDKSENYLNAIDRALGEKAKRDRTALRAN